MLNVHSDVVCPLLTHFTTMENLSSSASSSGKSYTSSAFLLDAASEPVARLAVAFPPACVPAKNPSSSVHHTFLPPPHRSSTVKPRVASLASLAIRAEFPPRSNSRLVVARLSWNSNRTLTLAFALDAAAHRTKHTRNTPASVSRCAFSSRQSLRRFTRASIRIATPRTTNEPSDGALGVDVHDVASFTSTASSSRVVIEVIIDRDAPALRTRRSARRLGRRRLSLRRAHHRSLRSLRRNTDWRSPASSCFPSRMEEKRTNGRTGPGRCEKTAVFDES